MSITNRALVCLVSLFLLSAIALAAQEPVIERPDFDSPVASPEIPVADGDGPTGTAPVLSVFSVVKYSGRILSSDGTPPTGVIGLTFAFYADRTDGAPLWIETQSVTLDEEGRYTVLLGSQTSEGLPLSLFASGDARWLGVQDSTGASERRILLVTVPYAMKAAEAETLGGRSADEFVLSDELASKVQAQITEGIDSDEGLTLEPGAKGNPIFGVGTPGHITKFIETDIIADAAIFEDPATGNVGIGTATPSAELEVAGDFRVTTGAGGFAVLGDPLSPNLIGGHRGNFVRPGVRGATISGGGEDDQLNIVGSHYGTVGGGMGNEAGSGNFSPNDSRWATVGGGWQNDAFGESSTVAGGFFNAIHEGSDYASIGGGVSNKVAGANSTIAGGVINWAGGDYSAIGGGNNNVTDGKGSVVPGGEKNHAIADYSFAAGHQARAEREGAFVWADSSGVPITSIVVNQFTARATGGFRFIDDVDVAGEITGGVFIDTTNGKILSGMAGGAETFSVANDGTVTAAAFVGDGSGLTNVGQSTGPNTINVMLGRRPMEVLAGSSRHGSPEGGVLQMRDGANVTYLRVCGLDDDMVEGTLGARLVKRSVFGVEEQSDPIVVAQVSSGIEFASGTPQCFAVPVDEIADNTQFIYYVEMDSVGPVIMSVMQVVHQ